MNPSPFSPFSGTNANAQAGYYASPIDLSAVMRQVYLWLAMGLAIGFGIAFAIGHEVQRELNTLNSGQDISDLHLTTFLINPVVRIVTFVAYIGIGIAFFPVVQRASVTVAASLYAIFTAIFGFMISIYFIVFDAGTITAAFAVTAGMFVLLSLIGYTTRIDLSRFRAILVMALIGLVIASIVNIFLRNPAVYWIVTYAGVLIFSGLIAYDTQWLKRNGAALAGSSDKAARLALVGAFKLFLDFVNLFLFILRILGRSGRN